MELYQELKPNTAIFMLNKKNSHDNISNNMGFSSSEYWKMLIGNSLVKKNGLVINAKNNMNTRLH